MWLQFISGVLAAVIFGILLAGLCFLARGKNIIEEKYFKYDFTIVVCLILFLNSFYLILVLMQDCSYLSKDRIPNKEKSHDLVGNINLDILAIYPIGTRFYCCFRKW